MQNSSHNDSGFLDLADALLRRADERLNRDFGIAFHKPTMVEFAVAFGGTASLWRCTDDEVQRLVASGTDDPKTTEDTVRSATPAEVSRAGEHWVIREDLDDRAWLVLSVSPTMSVPPSEFEDVLLSCIRMHADAERRNLLRLLGQQVDRQNALVNLISRLHQVETREQVSNILATDGAAVMGIDRVSVVLKDASNVRLIASTGVADPERRANAAECIEALAGAVQSSGSDLAWVVDGAEDADDAGVAQVHVQRCTEIAESTSIRAHRIGAQGVLVLEQFGTPVPTLDLVPGLAGQAETALANIDARANPLARETAKLKRTLFGSGKKVLATIATVIVALWLIPAPFEVEAVGVLQPTDRREIFAPEDGRIVEVLAHDSDRVQSNVVLLRMENAELELQRERLRGEMETATSQLAAVTAARGSIDPTTGLSQAALADELAKRIASLKRQLDLVDQQVASLTVQSAIGGIVSHGDLSRSLVGRPVQKGQFLMQVADPDASWEVLLQVPDKTIRHVLRNRGDGDPAVSFVLRMAPGRQYAAKLNWVGSTTDLDESGQLSTPARVTLDGSVIPEVELAEMRPGASVVAKIDCGWRSVGYVWFHDFIDLVQRKVLF